MRADNSAVRISIGSHIPLAVSGPIKTMAAASVTSTTMKLRGERSVVGDLPIGSAFFFVLSLETAVLLPSAEGAS